MSAPVYLTFAACWALALAIGQATGFEVYGPGVNDACVLAVLLAFRTRAVRARYPALRPVATACEYAYLAGCVGLVSMQMSYAVQAFDRPYQDAAFQAFDRLAGFDYPAFMAWVARWPALHRALAQVYGQYALVAVVAFVAGAWTRPGERTGERFFVAFTLSLTLASIVSGLFPACGAVLMLDPESAKLAVGATPLENLDAVRAGILHDVPNHPSGGIISFPSMHVGLALLLLYAFRRSRPMLLCFAPVSAVYAFTALSCGGHYLADCLAAVPTVGVAVFLTEAAFRREERAPALVARTA